MENTTKEKFTRENAAEMLLELVTEKKITQAYIAEKTGITRATISAIVSKNQTPNSLTLYKLNKYIHEMV